jgi:hypothetical protein
MHHLKKVGFPIILVIAVIFIAFAMYASKHRITDSNPNTSMNPIQSHRSYMLRSDAAEAYQSNTPSSYTFSIVDEQGNTLKDFQTVHTKIMHVIVVRKDLAEFQHVHPDFNKATGQFTLSNLTFLSDGSYRIFTDFTPVGTMMGPDGMPLGVTLNQDVQVGNLANYKPQSLQETAITQTFNGYQVQLATNPTTLTAGSASVISYTIQQNGKVVTNLENYLGALGHSIVLSEGDLEFIHAHALNTDITKQNGTVGFHVTFPKPGKYKLFTQFQHQGKVITTSFVVNVGAAPASENMGSGNMMNMQGMDHSMHMTK